MQDNNINAAIYCRLSVADKVTDRDNSDSIDSQKMMLERYAKENGFVVVGHYVDDGYSGTKFDNRPDFNRMLEDIENKRINAVLIKDLSRLGRNYIEVGRYQEIIFPEKGVRLVAPNDGYDSNNGSDDFSPIRNMFNDFYARDISNKTRKALAIRAQAGMYIGRGVYGYKRSPDDKHKLIIDEKTAPIVRRIFNMAADGYGHHKIAAILENEGIPNPAAARNDEVCDSYNWERTTVRLILKNPVYAGNMVQLRHTIQSYRVGKRLKNPDNKLAIVENTHEPIVSKDTWETVQAIHETRRKSCGNGEYHIFAGLLKCATCGSALAKGGSSNMFTCSKYKIKGSQYCTNHSIKLEKLTALVLDDIKDITRQIRKNKVQFIKDLSGENDAGIKNKADALKKERSQKQTRLEKLSLLIRKLFEQNVDGILPDEAYRQMLSDYKAEQATLQKQLAGLDEKASEAENNADNVNSFVALIEKYCDITELDSSIVHELIERIDVHQHEKINGVKHQQIDITYRFVGQI